MDTPPGSYLAAGLVGSAAQVAIPELHLDAFDHQEKALGTLPVVRCHEANTGTAHEQFRVELSGGPLCVAKPDDRGGDPAMISREVAAWRVARMLGWADLVPVTVLRTIDTPRGPLRCSLQVAMHPVQNWPDAADFQESDRLRAAVYDILVMTTDRGGQNWLGIDPPPRRLVLIDHGHAFAPPGSGVNSTFVTMCDALLLGTEVEAAVHRLLGDDLAGILGPLLPADTIQSLIGRAHGLLRIGSVARP